MEYFIQTDSHTKDFNLNIINQQADYKGILSYYELSDSDSQSVTSVQSNLKSSIKDVEKEIMEMLNQKGYCAFAYPSINEQYHCVRVDFDISDKETKKTIFNGSLYYVRERHTTMTGSELDSLDNDIIKSFQNEFTLNGEYNVKIVGKGKFHYDENQVKDNWLFSIGNRERISLNFYSLDNKLSSKKILIKIRKQNSQKKFLELFGINESFQISCSTKESYALSKSVKSEFK